MKAVKVTVTGDVQGVSYRYYARAEAKKIGLVGWAKNEHDGTVTIFAQGPDEKITEFIGWAKEGSPMATVNNATVESIETISNLTGFEVK